MKRIAPAAVAALIGWIGGSQYENLKKLKQVDVSLSLDTASCLKSSITSPLPSLEPAVIDSKPLPEKHDSAQVTTIMKFGFPSIDSIKVYKNFVLSYDRRNRTSNWVFEHLTPQHLDYSQKIDRNKFVFYEDETIPKMLRPTNKDYLGSGYDRGHLAPAANHRASEEDYRQTFVLSNIAPQVGRGFNRGVWNKLEKYVRYRAKRMKNTWSCTGPLYLPRIDSISGRKYIQFEVIGDNDVSVPTHFFKVLVFEDYDGNFDLESYVIENAPEDDKLPLQAFFVPLDSIERSAGFMLFDKIPRSKFRSINGTTNTFLDKFNLWYKNLKPRSPSPTVR